MPRQVGYLLYNFGLRLKFKNIEMLSAAILMHFFSMIEVILVILSCQNCNCKENEIFPSSVFNSVSVEDYIGDDLYFEILYPKELQYTYRLRKARNFGSLFTNALKGVRLVASNPFDCCSFPINAGNLKGSVALVLRGHCSFLSKALKAEEAGAIAVIIMDDDDENDSLLVEMIDDNTDRESHIPAAFLMGKSGYIIQRKLEELHLDAAIINIPINMTFAEIHNLNQPPWIRW